MSRTRLGVSAALTSAVVLAAAAAPGARAAAYPHAHAAKACSLAGNYQSLGPTYVEQLNVQGVTCATGLKLVKAYYKCRVDAGGVKGRCHSKVLGFRCTERRSAGPVQFVASVRCSRGRAVVTHKYSENT
jgi:hypothetical protein